MALIESLIEIVAGIWQADTEIRDRSHFGESELERRARWFVAWLCGGFIVLIAVAGFFWWWFAR